MAEVGYVRVSTADQSLDLQLQAVALALKWQDSGGASWRGQDRSRPLRAPSR